jgi:hypothetical protein
MTRSPASQRERERFICDSARHERLDAATIDSVVTAVRGPHGQPVG